MMNEKTKNLKIVITFLPLSVRKWRDVKICDNGAVANSHLDDGEWKCQRPPQFSPLENISILDGP